MGYYARGDYYRGDYYRGDFWSDLGGGIKRIGQGVVGAVGGFLTGGPTGAIVGGAKGLFGGSGGKAPASPVFPPGGGIQIPGLGPLGGIGTLKPGAAGAGVRKRGRRMNVTNVKALRRSIRRAKGFSKLARTVLTFTEAHAPRGKARFKAKRRR